MTTNKDGVYQCKKHGSAGEDFRSQFECLIVRPGRNLRLLKRYVRVQLVFRLEETDYQSEDSCQEGGQKVVALVTR